MGQIRRSRNRFNGPVNYDDRVLVAQCPTAPTFCLFDRPPLARASTTIAPECPTAEAVTRIANYACARTEVMRHAASFSRPRVWPRSRIAVADAVC